jgi:hypothetical protein
MDYRDDLGEGAFHGEEEGQHIIGTLFSITKLTEDQFCRLISNNVKRVERRSAQTEKNTYKTVAV